MVSSKATNKQGTHTHTHLGVLYLVEHLATRIIYVYTLIIIHRQRICPYLILDDITLLQRMQLTYPNQESFCECEQINTTNLYSFIGHCWITSMTNLYKSWYEQ